MVKLRPNSFKSCGELIPTPDLNTLTPVTDLVSQIHPAEETQVISWSCLKTWQSRCCIWIGCLYTQSDRVKYQWRHALPTHYYEFAEIVST